MGKDTAINYRYFVGMRQADFKNEDEKGAAAELDDLMTLERLAVDPESDPVELDYDGQIPGVSGERGSLGRARLMRDYLHNELEVPYNAMGIYKETPASVHLFNVFSGPATKSNND